jgi:hypothetical protein
MQVQQLTDSHLYPHVIADRLPTIWAISPERLAGLKLGHESQWPFVNDGPGNNFSVDGR